MAISLEKIVNNFVDVKDFDYDRKFSRVTRLHKYWSRKPWFIVGEYVRKYSSTNEKVLDPFCGSGIIGLEAILSGRHFVGYDLNPFATFLAENTLNTDYDASSVNHDFALLKKEISRKIMDLYHVGGNEYILYTVMGHKNTQNYNAVISDKLFKKKEKVVLEEKKLNPRIRFPKDLNFPDKSFPEKFYKDRFSYKGVSKVSDMFTKRNLLSLALLYDTIQRSKLINKDLFVLAFTNTLLHASKLKAENVRPLSVNNFWIPDDFIEENVWWRFLDRLKNVQLAKEVVAERNKKNNSNAVGNFKIYNKSSLKMKEVENKSVDYLITDPPYGDTIQYSELSYIWNCWLGKNFKIKDEVVINPAQDKGISEYKNQLKLFINETKRVLKKGGYFTLAFQNKDLNIWIVVAELIRDNSMTLKDISSYSTFGNPYNKNWSKFSPKSDFYVTFQNTGRKINSKNKGVYPEEIAKDIVDYLGNNNGALFNLNKAYDLFVAVVLSKIFGGYVIYGCEKLNVEKVIGLFQQIIESNYGNIQKRLFQNI
jgi:DNA modification methylase